MPTERGKTPESNFCRRELFELRFKIQLGKANSLLGSLIIGELVRKVQSIRFGPAISRTYLRRKRALIVGAYGGAKNER